MKVLCIGDSITRGTTGVSYVQLLAREYPEWIIENAGIDGEPLSSIARRLRQKLETGEQYDIIVIQAGTNDVLLPIFKNRGPLFMQAYRHCIETGRIPLSPDRFNITYRTMLELICHYSRARIVVCTIACINENRRTAPNDERRMYNNIIRILGSQYECAVADVSLEFERELSPLPGRDYCLNSFINTTFLDYLQCRFFNAADRLSKARRLKLTIDGVHLNTKGALLFKQEIEKALDYFPRHCVEKLATQ